MPDLRCKTTQTHLISGDLFLPTFQLRPVVLILSTDTCCSTRSLSPVNSWWLLCVTSNRHTHNLEVRFTVLQFLPCFNCSSTLANNFKAVGEKLEQWQHCHYPCFCLSATTMWFWLSGKRPFGVSLLYMGWDKHYGFQLYQSDPSGNYGGWKATCIGNNSAVSALRNSSISWVEQPLQRETK